MEWKNEGEEGDGNMSWMEPKTDWTGDDRFDAPNYNRIKNNLLFLHEMAEMLYHPFEIGEMGPDKDYSSFYYADEINMLSDNLEQIHSNIYPVAIGEKTVYVQNQAFIGYEDLNRIEAAALRIYTLLKEQKENKPRLSFRLGNRKQPAGIPLSSKK